MHISDTTGLSSTECELLELTEGQTKKEKKSGSLLKYLQDAIIHFCNYFYFTNRLHTFHFIYLFKNPKYTSTVIIVTVAPTRAGYISQSPEMASKTRVLFRLE